jgi:hypothetical protein
MFFGSGRQVAVILQYTRLSKYHVFRSRSTTNLVNFDGSDGFDKLDVGLLSEQIVDPMV